jgi:hypothetical protein
MSTYTIYLDKEENFLCEASIKNSSYKNASARLIIESEDVNLVFYGNIDKNTINVPIKSLKKYFTENDNAKIKLEVIVENQLIIPWESEVVFDNYNKVEIKEIKSTKASPIVEVKIKESSSKFTVETKEKNKKSPREELLSVINEEVKKIKSDGKLSKEEKKQLIKNLLSNSL